MALPLHPSPLYVPQILNLRMYSEFLETHCA